MQFRLISSLFAAATLVSASAVERSAAHHHKHCSIGAPKVFIISMFDPEADVWYANANTPGSFGDLLACNVTIPGFSPLFPQAHCTEDGSVCQLTTGESEINAASTIAGLVYSKVFDLSKTYFMVAGIAGVNPKHATIGAVTFAKYAIQVALQYEFDARSIPSNFTNGYVPLGAFSPDQYPVNIYGTEVFEVNEALRDIAIDFAKGVELNDSCDAIAYRAKYDYPAAKKAPSVLPCDVATSDVYFSGTLLGEAFENTTTLFTNGTATYCTTAQEDNATLEVMMRAAVHGLVDYARIIIMRTASDFDRPYPGQSDIANLLYSQQGAFEPSIQNIYLAGERVVSGILAGWERKFKAGIKPTNYIGDIFGTLGGEPDFGPGSIFGGKGFAASQKPAKPGKGRRDAYRTMVVDSGMKRRL